MKAWKFLALLFLASLAIKIPFSVANTSFGVDETLYLATARHFVETGDFGIRTDFYDYKFLSPLFPSIASAFYFVGGQNGVLLIAPIFSSLAILIFYFLGKHVANEKVGRIAAIIGFFSSSLFILSSRPLTESVALFFFSFATLSMYLALKDKKYRIFSFAFPILFVLTFLARFQYGGVLLFLFVAYLVISKGYKRLSKLNFVYGVIASLLLASPWILFNLENYGSPLGAPASQASTDLGFSLSTAYLYFPYLFIVLGTVVPFVFYGLYKTWRMKNVLLLLGFFAVFLVQFFVFGKVAEERYLLPILPASVVIGAIGFFELQKRHRKIVNYAFVSLIILGVGLGVFGANYYHEYPRYNDTKEAVVFLKENCSSPVMSNSFTHVWYYAGYENIPIQSSEEKSLGLSKKRGVSCILFSKYEVPFNDYFEGSINVKKIFSNGGTSVYAPI